MNTSIRNYLSHLRLAGHKTEFERACPKCKKKHGEYRRVDLSLVTAEQHMTYTEHYQSMCFVCIQVELLLPSE